jgi:hypothetical protein
MMKTCKKTPFVWKLVLLLVVLALLLPSSNVRADTMVYLPGDSFYPTLAPAARLTQSYGSCWWDDGGAGNTVCSPVWRRAILINGSGFNFTLFTDAQRRGFLQIWVDGTLRQSLSFNHWGWRTVSITGLTPGVHEVLLRVDGTVCADPEDTDNCADAGNPSSYYFNTLTVLGPGDLNPPANPAWATETHGALDGIWQNSVATPEFTWPDGTDAESGVAGYEVYFGSDQNGTSVNFQAGTTYTTTVPVADGRYSFRLRTRDRVLNTAPWVTLFDFLYDGTPPNIALAHTGISGAGGWWMSALDLSATITDVHSGVALAEMSLDGGAAQPVSDQTFSADGVYTVVYTVTDLAGNLASLTEQVWMDQTPPVAQLDVSGTPGENGWYLSDVDLQAHGTDVTSGLASAELDVNSSGIWTNTTTLTANGMYAVDYRATDVAGWTVVNGPETIRIDQEQPIQNILHAPADGQVITEQMDFVGASLDLVSGLQSVAYRVDNGAWSPVTLVGAGGTWEFRLHTDSLEDGLRTIAIRTKDMAGNATVWQVQVQVQKPVPVPAQGFVLFARLTAIPTPTPLPSPTPTVSEQEALPAAQEPMPVVVQPPLPTTVATMPSVPLIYEGEKPQPISMGVALSVLPILGLLSAVLLLYDPRPAQLTKFVQYGYKIQDHQELKTLIAFVSGSLIDQNSHKEKRS